MTGLRRASRLGGGAGCERGSGTVLGLALVAVLLTMTLALVGLAGAVHARGAAQSAADLAALAGATVLHDPGSPGTGPCAVAGQVATANGAEMTGCRVVGEEVEVTAVVAVLGDGWPVDGQELRARAHARAGPTD